MCWRYTARSFSSRASMVLASSRFLPDSLDSSCSSAWVAVSCAITLCRRALDHRAHFLDHRGAQDLLLGRNDLVGEQVLQLAYAAALEQLVVAADAREQRLLRGQRDHVVARQLEQPAGLVDLAIDRHLDLSLGS